LNPEQKIVSFVLRFVYEAQPGEPDGRAEGWYSVIRHVQSDVEHRFTRWRDIEAFIEQYIDLSKDKRDE
jgi:hypothetical protein